MGERRAAEEKSPYAARSERKGQLPALIDFLRLVRAAVLKGATLLEGVADGTVNGWRARQALSHCLGEPLANWDRQRGRTQLEREAVIERALGELGASPQRHGGWSVSR